MSQFLLGLLYMIIVCFLTVAAITMIAIGIMFFMGFEEEEKRDKFDF